MSTFYVSALNQNGTLGLAEHTGSLEIQEAVSNTIEGEILLADAQEAFLFQTTPDAATDNFPLAATGDEDSSNWTAVAKTATTNKFKSATSLGDHNSGAILTIEKQLAEAVFGSNTMFDLFSNGAVIQTSITTAFNTMNTSVQTSTAITASQQYGNAMLANKIERFALQYNIVPPAAVANTTSVYHSARITGVTGVAVAKVVFTTATNLTSITVTSITTGTFTQGEELSITDPTGKTSLQITIPSASTLWDPAMLTALNTTPGTLGANFTGPGSSTTFVLNTVVAGTFTGVVAAQTGFGSTAVCTMQIDTTNSDVLSIYCTGPTSGYLKGKTTTFTNTHPTPVVFTSGAKTSNSIQAGILNGNMGTANTEFPTELDDVLRVMFELNVNSSQVVAGTSDTATMAYKAHVDYKVVSTFTNSP